MAGENAVLSDKPCLIKATSRISFLRAVSQTTYLTRSRRMIAKISCVARSSSPARESPSRMLASMSKFSDVIPAETC